MEEIEMIRENARLAVESLGPISEMKSFGFNRESVAWVERFIEGQRARSDVGEDERRRLGSVLGCFLGECIIRTYGGSWQKGDDGWGIYFDPDHAAFPLAKVRKQFEHGVEGGDSVLGFFDGIGPLFKRGADPAPKGDPSPGGHVPRRSGFRPAIILATVLGLGILGALFIPTLLQHSRVPPEHPALAALKKIASAQSEYREWRRKIGGRAEYWRQDVAGLYAQKGEDGSSLRLLELSIAAADDRPATDLSALARRAAKSGYWYRALRYEDEKSPDPNRFAVCALPEESGNQRAFFLITEGGQFYKKTPGSSEAAPELCPGDPSRSGWTKID